MGWGGAWNTDWNGDQDHRMHLYYSIISIRQICQNQQRIMTWLEMPLICHVWHCFCWLHLTDLYAFRRHQITEAWECIWNNLAENLIAINLLCISHSVWNQADRFFFCFFSFFLFLYITPHMRTDETCRCEWWARLNEQTYLRVKWLIIPWSLKE